MVGESVRWASPDGSLEEIEVVMPSRQLGSLHKIRIGPLGKEYWIVGSPHVKHIELFSAAHEALTCLANEAGVRRDWLKTTDQRGQYKPLSRTSENHDDEPY